MAKQKKPLEAVSGTYAAVPHRLLDSPAFIGLTDSAKSLLFALFRQLNGRNNGHLQLSQKWLAGYGWRSSGMNRKARDELIERGLIIRTRLGGLNMGTDWFAATWLPISDFSGLDVSPHQYHPGAWQLCTLPPTQKRKPPARQKRETLAGSQRSAAPVVGTVGKLTAPVVGAETALFQQFTAPVVGNNVFTNPPPANNSKRVVGRAGRSGKKSEADQHNLVESKRMAMTGGSD